MKNFILNYAFVAVFILLTSCSGKPEKQGQKTIFENQDKTHAMKSWFLSTGNWETDPQIYVREFGTGNDTIVMLHGGWGAEHSGMIDMVSGLEKEYKFFVHEQRGSLRSPFPDSLITYSRHIADVELLRKELGVRKLTLLGHSMGAVLASAYAERYPKHVEKLILVSPAFLKNPFPDKDMELLRSSQKAYEDFSERPEVARELQRLNLLRNSPKLSSKEETIKNRIGFANMMLFDIGKWHKLNNGKALYKGNVYGLTENTYPKEGWNFIEEFKEQSYPIAVVVGDHDRFDMGNHIIHKWITEVPRANFTSINDAGHLLWIDQPENLLKTLKKSL
ncbi:alpha/beta fold hydrolase [Maribacter sp. 2307UL18-2]|uniref:alpha/beta fold hydrolase n=1 Tax=Maribacter sp. 2307UL18-2 TaxID=3386274 RepID=UPI0039BC8190